MHAINLAIILPGFLTALWIWPQLRRPWIWMTIGLVTLISTVIWLGLDFRADMRLGHSTDQLPRRVAFKLISQNIPVVQLLLGSAVALIGSWFFRPVLGRKNPIENSDAKTDIQPDSN